MASLGYHGFGSHSEAQEGTKLNVTRRVLVGEGQRDRPLCFLLSWLAELQPERGSSRDMS